MKQKPKFDWAGIEAHVDLLIASAASMNGYFTIFVTHGEVPGAITHHKPDDREGILSSIKAHEDTSNANIYISYALLKSKPTRRERGGKDHLNAIIGLVVDLDADTGKTGEMPVEPSFEIETSPGNRQSVILFDRPMSPEDASPLAKALQRATGADSGTGDIAHVWRIAGTLNWPNEAKLKRGRNPDPCCVTIIKRFEGRRYDRDELAKALAEHMNVAPSDAGCDRFESEVDSAPLLHRISDLALHMLKGDGEPDRSAHAARVVERLHFENFALNEIVSLCLSEAGDWTNRYRTRKALISDIERLWNKFAAPKNAERERAANGAGAFVKGNTSAAANDNDVGNTIDAETLLATEFEELRYVIPGYVVEGLTIVAGKPKLGKSWLAYDFAIAVASGGLAMGSIECEQGDVLYLALEDNHRRAKSRIQTVMPPLRKFSLKRLQLQFTAPTIDSGLLPELDKWRIRSKNPRLIIIDVLAKVKPPQKKNQGVYAADYDAITPLQKYASEHRLAVVVITHTRKQEADDTLETVSGTNGLTGAADSILILSRDANGSILYGRGRDIEEIETAMLFDAGKWSVLGHAGEVRKSDERKKIIQVLMENGELSPAEIAKLTGLKSVNVRQLLRKMVKAGDVSQPRTGSYSAMFKREAA